jgi:shikimate dehydrogenase
LATSVRAPLRLGLVGNPVRHSLSPALFERFFRKSGVQGSYEIFELNAAHEVPLLFETFPNLVGVNVTIPFKKQIIPFLDRLDDTARDTGSVNVVKRLPDGSRVGFNTDVVGFEATFRPFLPLFKGRALILGTGGAASAVAAVLRRHHIIYHHVSRKALGEVIAYQELTPALLEDVGLVVQATPCGMHGFAEPIPPFPRSFIHHRMILIDLVYTPRITPLMAAFRMSGARAVGGLRMLYVQALESWKIFNR